MNAFNEDKEPEYYLLHSDYKYVPMIPIQASRVNSAIALGQNPNKYLSKGQLSMLDYFRSHPDQGNTQAYHGDIKQEWNKKGSVLASK